MIRTERTYYAVFSLYCASWSCMTPVYTLFLLSLGLDLLEVNLVFAVYLIVAFLFEVPTGAIADVFGRKLSFLLSCALRTLAFGMYWSAHNFFDCVVAECVDAVGTTLATGALDAWAADGMREEGDVRPLSRVYARASLIASPVMIFGGLLGAYVADIHLALAWLCGAGGFALAGLVGLVLMRETHTLASRSDGLWRSWLRTTSEGVATVRHTPVLLLLCVLTAATAFAVMPAWHYWPARVQQLSGKGVWLLGWVWALVTLASMAGNALIPWLVPRFQRENVLTIAWAWRGSMLAVGAVSDNLIAAVAAVLVMQAVYGLSEPTLQGWMNEHVDSEVRATVLSVRSMAFTLGGGVGLICLGLVARSSGIAAAWAASAALQVIAAPGFLWLTSGRRALREETA